MNNLENSENHQIPEQQEAWEKECEEAIALCQSFRAELEAHCQNVTNPPLIANAI